MNLTSTALSMTAGKIRSFSMDSITAFCDPTSRFEAVNRHVQAITDRIPSPTQAVVWYLAEKLFSW